MRTRTGYSFKHAVGHLDEVADRLAAIGWSVGPMTDRLSTYGYVKWTKVCEKKGLRPIYGVELPVVADLNDKKSPADYWTFIAKEEVRYINRLVGLATSQGKFPALSYEQALKAEGVWKIGGERCLLSELEKAYGSSDFSDLRLGDFVLALSPSTPVGLARAAQRAGIGFIATSDNVFTNQVDREFYRVALGRHSGTQTYPQWILDEDEWVEATKWIVPVTKAYAAIELRDSIIKTCTAQLKKATLLTPEKRLSLRDMCLTGGATLGVNFLNPVYEARLNKELELIAEKDFEDYFYILADLMKFARANMIVGPARGSSCGSLVCYTLGITSVDPIPFDLLFERFIDRTRQDLPDVDLDFSDTQRHLIFEYAENKYGGERVARLGNVVSFQPRSALNAIGAALKIPKFRMAKVMDGIIERSSGDSRAMQKIEDTFKDTEAGRGVLQEWPEILVAARMEGHPNTASQHAAGLVLTQEPVADFVAIDERTGSAMCDKKDAESLNLLKIDALGLTQLSIFERTLELIHGQSTNSQGLSGSDANKFLNSLPLDDDSAFRVLNAGHFAGVFQFNGMSLQSLTKQIQVTDIEDIIAITALARPGPMASGGANTWVKRKNGAAVDFPHECFRPYIGQTLGIIIYQEQIMQIGREIGDLTWDDVTELRKAMSKSLGKEYFDKFGDRWKPGAISKGVAPHVADKVWDDMCAYGAWSFNRSHAVAYGIISYWCCWFKAHYPVEFAAATLDAESDAFRQLDLLRELHEEGITYVPVEMDHSTDRWTPALKDGQKILVGPLTSVKGIGPAAVKEILEARKDNKPIRSTLSKRLSEAKTELDDLWPISAAVKRLHPDLAAINIVSEPWKIKQVQCGVEQDVVIIGIAKKIAPKDENEAVNVAKRNGKMLTGPTSALNLFVKDDSDEIFCKINRYDFERIGRSIVEDGRQGKSIYAIKGSVPRGFRMISVKQVKYLGELDG